MSSSQTDAPHVTNEIISRKLHSLAKDQAKQHIDEFASALVLQAKILAFREKAELVLKRHIDEALDFTLSQRKKEWTNEFLKIVGGALLGAFVPGLMTALPAHDTTSAIVYIVVGFGGMLMVFVGLSR